jgi:hypothetical protein
MSEQKTNPGRAAELEAKALLSAVEEILSGIDATEIERDDGWWETSSGAEFGAEKLRQIRTLFGRS